MSQETSTEIRRRPDGSIDTGFYLARGLSARSRTAHHMLALVVAAAKHLAPALRRRMQKESLPLRNWPARG